MGRIHIHIYSEDETELSVQTLMERLKNPKWNYANLKQYLSLFTGQNVAWVEHVFQCIGSKSDSAMDMLLVWVILDDQSNRLYCVSVDEFVSVQQL